MLGAAALAAPVLPGCAVFVPPMTAALRTRPPAGLPRRSEIDAAPFHPQTEYHCGPAALATTLGAAGFTAAPEQLATQVFLPARQGTLQAEMLGGARRQGALPVRLPGTLEALLREVAAGTPVVVLQNLGLSFAPQWHYAVAVGYDLDAGELVLRSGTTRREVMSLRSFEYTWARSGHWAMVTLEPGRLPVSAGEAEVVEALVGFERAAPAADAVRAYAAALERWPRSLTLGMGLGNTLHADRRIEASAAAFERVASEHDSAAAWSNLAQVRLELGQREPARQAALRALERARSAEPRWLDAARQALALTE